jgi:glycosyltransferase involved in cell wall biosynthesis
MRLWKKMCGKTKLKVFAIIPAYEEADSVGKVVSEVIPYVNKALLIDDGSSDGTIEEAKRAGASVVRLPLNLGQGAALRTGFIIAKREKADIIVTLDADGQHDPREIPNLIRFIESGEADIVVGSRFQGTHSSTTFIRYLGIKFFTRLVRILIGIEISDLTCGFRAFRKEVLENLSLEQDQYSAPELLIKGARHGFRIIEVPVNIKQRVFGKPKKKLSTYWYGLLRSIFSSFSEK